MPPPAGEQPGGTNLTTDNNSTHQERNRQIKLTKADIKRKRAELVEVLLKIEKLKNDKTSLEKTLDADFADGGSATTTVRFVQL